MLLIIFAFTILIIIFNTELFITVQMLRIKSGSAAAAKKVAAGQKWQKLGAAPYDRVLLLKYYI